MKLDKKIKSNPTQIIMYGVLILFAGVMIVLVIANSLSNRPTSVELALTATQALAIANQTAMQSPIDSSGGIASTIPDSSSTNSASGSDIPSQGNALSGTGLPTSASNQDAPTAGNPLQGTAPVSSGQQTSIPTGGPPSNVSPPPDSQNSATEVRPPSGGTPPPTLQQSATEAGPPSGGTPPPTLQTTPTEIRPPSEVTPPPTPLPVGSGTYNDTNLAWQYSSGWTTYNGTGPYQSDFHYTGTPGNYVDLTFTGKGFTLIYTANPNRGLIDVYIDGDKVDTIDAYSTTTDWQSEWTSETLTNGTHTVRFVHAGEGTNIDVDAITILP